MKTRGWIALAGVGVLSLQGLGYYRWSHPDLTEARVIAELGRDELVLVFETEPEDRGVRRPCEKKSEPRSAHEGRDAAQAAGWIERICPDDPERMQLTADGRVRSKQWVTYPPGEREHAMQGWWVTVARYERSGPPRIGPRQTYEEDMPRPLPAHRVVIPGHWALNDDGRRLHETGWPPIRVVDRAERYTFWDGFWARNHGGS